LIRFRACDRKAGEDALTAGNVVGAMVTVQQEIPMTSRLCFLTVNFGLAIMHLAAQGQTISFLREFSVSGGNDRAIAVAVDSTALYVAGAGEEEGEGEGEGKRGTLHIGAGGGFLRKSDELGNEQWTRRLGPGSANGIAVDAASIYVVGGGRYESPSGLPAFASKYDAEGNELWTRQFGRGSANGVAVDATGIYVVGKELQPSGYDTGFMHKYAADGRELWARQFSFSSGGGVFKGSANAVAVDATGVYVVGRAGSGWFLRKHTADGEEIWTRTVEFGARGVALDAGGIYVVGDGFQGDGAFLRKYDSSGNVLWSRQFGTVERVYRHASAHAVAVDSSGVYVVGRTDGTLPGQCRAGGSDAFVRRYTAEGDEVWTRQFGTFGGDIANGVAMHADGVYLAGVASVKAVLARVEKTPAPVDESRPHILWECVVNAASLEGGGVAPGEIVTIFGRAVGPPEHAPLHLTEGPRRLADTRVLFNGIAGPLLYVSEAQINTIVPYALAEGLLVEIQVEYNGSLSNVVTVPLLPARPGVFTLDGSGFGQGAILNEDGSINSPVNPAQRGSVITIYATGEGLTEPVAVDGLVLSDAPPRPRLPVSVWFELGPGRGYFGLEAQVLYAGGSPGSVNGLLQVNARVAQDAETGDAVGFMLSVGSYSTDCCAVTVALR
jgi:uncharacterized protein (TIGR03437 family)